ncbi:unnamed protein product, partial [Ilex paraguariensis]
MPFFSPLSSSSPPPPLTHHNPRSPHHQCPTHIHTHRAHSAISSHLHSTGHTPAQVHNTSWRIRISSSDNPDTPESKNSQKFQPHFLFGSVDPKVVMDCQLLSFNRGSGLSKSYQICHFQKIGSWKNIPCGSCYL